MEYKRKKEQGLQCMSLMPPSGRELAPEPTRFLRKRKKARSRQRQDASQRSFLLDEEDEDEDEDEDSSAEWGGHAHEAEDEWEAEQGGDSSQQGQQGLCGQRKPA